LGELPVRDKPLFWEYGRNPTSFAYPQDPKQKSPSLAVREGDWKLLVQPDGTGAELYQLTTDAKETTNLADREQERAARLTRMALQLRKSVP
jgi:arylsulfatase A-like enzyme